MQFKTVKEFQDYTLPKLEALNDLLDRSIFYFIKRIEAIEEKNMNKAKELEKNIRSLDKLIKNISKKLD